MDQLPQEILRNILFRLPKKSIYNVLRVCKRWKSLLCDPEFTIPYTFSTTSRYAYLLKWTNYNNEKLPLFANQHILALVQDNPANQAAKMSVLIQNDASDLVVIGSIDGVFCLSYGVANTVILWNPATGDSRKAPCPSISTDFHSAWSIGFARNHNADGVSIDGYKVVRMVEKRCVHYNDEIGPCPSCPVKTGAEVYDTSTHIWTNIDFPFGEGKFDNIGNRCNVIVKGAPYWSTKSDLIVSFDPRKNKFDKFERPDFGNEDFDVTGWSLGEMEESLVALVERLDKSVDVWRCNFGNGESGGKVNWSKMFSVGPVEGVERWLSCWKNGEFLVASGDNCGSSKKLNLYDCRGKGLRVLPDFGSPECVSHDVFVYVHGA